jgi:hypothetical protein
MPTVCLSERASGLLNRSIPAFLLASALIPSLCFSQIHAAGPSAVADSGLKTKVYIIGVVHTANERRNADSLIKILGDIRPDLILDETDTLSGYFKKDYTLAKPSWRYNVARSLRLARDMPPENKAMYRYVAMDPSVKALPFDLAITRRRKYIRRMERNDGAYVRDVNRVYQGGGLPDSLKKVHDGYVAYSTWLYETTLDGYREINRPVVIDSIRALYRLESTHVPALLDAVPALERHRAWREEDAAYWKHRNETMAANILRFLRTTQARRVVVFTGLLHKHYLIDLLSPVAESLGFEMAEFTDQGH